MPFMCKYLRYLVLVGISSIIIQGLLLLLKVAYELTNKKSLSKIFSMIFTFLQIHIPSGRTMFFLELFYPQLT